MTNSIRPVVVASLLGKGEAQVTLWGWYEYFNLSIVRNMRQFLPIERDLRLKFAAANGHLLGRREADRDLVLLRPQHANLDG
jgi:hypothetical protein